MRSQALTTVKAGIQRLREKGGASAESLFDLVNGYVTAQRTIKARPGTVHEVTLPAGTKGLMAFGGKLIVFAIEPLAVPNDLFRVEVVAHPTEPRMALIEILFAEPFLGFPYVVAEFADGSTHHYWLQRRDPWEANRVYAPGDIVEPTSPNGFAYRARTIDTEGTLLWAPNVARGVGDEVVPTAGGQWTHEVIAVAGAAPRSGATEPTWATTEGGVTIEDADAPPEAAQPPPTTAPPPGTGLPPPTGIRYDLNISLAER
jgi:hypothetical protein